MTDAVWLLWNRALIDYAKAVSMRLLIRVRRDKTDAGTPPDSQPANDDLELPTPY